MTAEQAMAIFAGQAAAFRLRREYAIVWARLAEFCRARAASYAESARQSANLAEGAIKQYARLAPQKNDELERALGGIRSLLDERDNAGAA